jgi:uncharacterized protein (TIGR01777 family)
LVNILISGGTGLVGQLLSEKLFDKGYNVRVLTRSPKKDNEFYWNLKTNEVDENAFYNLDYIIHLAGAGIADKRWTTKRKQEIIDSRIKSTELLFTKIKTHKIPLKGFIAASAIGYYGAITSDTIFTEFDTPGNDFISNVCQQWEESTLTFEKIAIPTTILRTGIVLSKKGGALEKMKTPIISPIASGKQYVPWIHIEDLTNIFIKAIEDTSFTGIYNAVAPEHQTSFSFSKSLAKKSNKLFLSIGVPKFLLQIIFGQMSMLLTTGSRVSSQKIEKTGYFFSYKKLDEAFDDLI